MTVVVWLASGEAGWDLEEARPYHPRWIGGGIRTLYEVAAALAAAGHEVELRGNFSPRHLDEICEAAGARPELPEAPRPPEASDTVIVSEGIDVPEAHARLALSPARAVLMVLGPPGLVGWPFAAGWSRPDPVAVDLDELARPDHFRAAAGLGYELWTHTPGLARAAEGAGVACRLVGNGVPGGYPTPARARDIDVVWLSENRWAPLARPVVDRLAALGVECLAVEETGQRELLEVFGRARVLLHPVRIEGHSRIGCEARGMGAVPVVLPSSFGVGLDEAGGAVAVADASDMARAVVELLNSPDRLARLSAAGMRSAREQVEWEPFVERVEAALGEEADDPVRPARATIGEALRERHRSAEQRLGSVLAERDHACAERDQAFAERDRLRAELDDVLGELERHRQWLESTNASLSWRATAPLRAAKRSLARIWLS